VHHARAKKAVVIYSDIIFSAFYEDHKATILNKNAFGAKFKGKPIIGRKRTFELKGQGLKFI
jgi:hypothetical protein